VNPEIIHIIVEGAVLPVVGLVGWLLARLIKGVDDNVKEIKKDLAVTVAKVGTHEAIIAVHEYRLNKIDKT